MNQDTQTTKKTKSYIETKYTGQETDPRQKRLSRRVNQNGNFQQPYPQQQYGQPNAYEDYDDYDDYDEDDLPQRPKRDYEEFDTRDMDAEDDYYERPAKKSRSKASKKPKKKKKHPIRKIFVILFCLILVFVLLCVNVFRKFNHVDTEVSQNRGTLGDQVNILLIGQDAREGQEQQRSDSMMLLTINKSNGTVILTSLMRDMYVDIPGYNANRINAAYSYGGVDLLDETIQQDFGITIDGNAMVDLEGFAEAMAGVAPLDIELTQEEADYMNANPAIGTANDEAAADANWNLTAGMNSLTAEQVLCYSRMRHVGNSDWDRTARQRIVMQTALNKVKHGHLIGGYKMASNAAPYITTDMNTMMMIQMAFALTANKEMQSYLIPVAGTYSDQNIDGMAVLVPDMDANRSYLQQYMSGEYDDDSSDE